MKQFIRSIAVLLLCSGLAQGAWGQIKITGPGFLPDESGTNLDNPLPTQQQKVATGTIIKDCTECPEMVIVPAGGFTMGSDSFEQAIANYGKNGQWIARENPRHNLVVSSFLVGRFAITVGEFSEFVRKTNFITDAERNGVDAGCMIKDGAQWKAIDSKNWRNPGFVQGSNHPVVCVSWNDVAEYIKWLNFLSGRKYRLLSESEREYVTRSGTQTAFWWGNTISPEQANYDGTQSFNGGAKGVFRQNSTPVDSFSPNYYGLYNVHGNIYEWLADCWHEVYINAPADGSPWNTGCVNDQQMVQRGGAWNEHPSFLRAAGRVWNLKSNRRNIAGFRLARDL